MNNLKKAFAGQSPYIHIDEWNKWVTNNELNDMSWYEYYFGKQRNQKLTENQMAYVLTELFHDLLHNNLFLDLELGLNPKTTASIQSIDYNNYEIKYVRKGREESSFYLHDIKANKIISKDIKSKELPVLDWPMEYQPSRVFSKKTSSYKPINPYSPLTIVYNLFEKAIK